jgi:uncharacterized membrane protein (DUF373 family)
MNKPVDTLRSFIRRFEMLIIVVLILLMMAVVTISLMELVQMIVVDVIEGGQRILRDNNMLNLLGYFMMVLIALELLETIKNYLTENAIHVEVVLLVAMIAVARKVIILDMKELQPLTLFGIAAVILSLSGSYWLMKKTEAPSKSTETV